MWSYVYLTGFLFPSVPRMGKRIICCFGYFAAFPLVSGKCLSGWYRETIILAALLGYGRLTSLLAVWPGGGYPNMETYHCCLVHAAYRCPVDTGEITSTVEMYITGHSTDGKHIYRTWKSTRLSHVLQTPFPTAPWHGQLTHSHSAYYSEIMTFLWPIIQNSGIIYIL